MSIATPAITSFTSGEISPRLAGRVDVAKYFAGCRKLENFHVHPHGGVTRRSGMRFVMEAASQSDESRLISFEFSVDQTYILEFSPLKMRVFHDQGAVLNEEGAIYERETPYTAEDIQGLRFCQSLDVLVLVCPGHTPQRLTRTDHDNWTLTAISGAPTDGGNNAIACCFYQDRLWLALPNGAIHFSKIGDYWNFTQPALTEEPAADEAGEVTIRSGQGNRIEFLQPKDKLYVGTRGGTWTIYGIDDTITPDGVRAQQASTVGAGPSAPLLVQDSALYVQRSGRQVMEMAYYYQTDNYPSRDMTIFAEHISRSGLKEMAYCAAPDSIVYALRNDGVLLACTFMREQDVVAWSRIITNGKVESIASIHNDSIGRDELWAVVAREVNGVTKRFVEYLEAEFNSAKDETVEDSFFLDAAVTFDLAEKTTYLDELEHLAGAEVDILVDGAVVPSQTVKEDGTLELKNGGKKIHVGFGYASVLEPMPLEVGSQRGTAQTKSKFINKISVRFYNTVGGKVGLSPEKLDTIFSRTSQMAVGKAVPITSGDKEIVSPSGWNKDGCIHIRQDQPLPMTVLMIVPTQVLNT